MGTKKTSLKKQRSAHDLLSKLDVAANPYTLLLVTLLVLGVLAAKHVARNDDAHLLPLLKQPSNGSHKAKDNHPPAWSYFHPIWNQDPLEAKQDDLLSWVVQDPYGRLAEDFQVPQAAQARVKFWLQIHTRFPSQIRVLHDRFRPDIIWGYIDVGAAFREAETKGKAETAAWRIERDVEKHLREVILESAGLTKTSFASDFEKAQIRKVLSRRGAMQPAQVWEIIGYIRTQVGQRDEFIAGIERSKTLMPFIESHFKSKDLPIELTRIPFVESSFQHRAHSKVGAMGIWQFMPETAMQMIHSEDSTKWADPLRQTRAAAKMLMIFRSLLPDWSTAVTAYNSGVGRLRRFVAKHRTHDVWPIVDRTEDSGLGFAGKNFYSQFLSVNLAYSYREELYLNPPESHEKAVAIKPRP